MDEYLDQYIENVMNQQIYRSGIEFFQVGLGEFSRVMVNRKILTSLIPESTEYHG